MRFLANVVVAAVVSVAAEASAGSVFSFAGYAAPEGIV